MTPRILVLGLGNDILTDDAVGLIVAREIGALLQPHESIDARSTTEMGLSLLDEITGYAGLILVDAAQTGRAPAGHIHELVLDDLHVLPSVTPHFLGVGETLALGKLLHLPMPQCVRVFGIEVEDMQTLGTELTPAVSAALPVACATVLAAAREAARRLNIRSPHTTTPNPSHRSSSTPSPTAPLSSTIHELCGLE